jgi:hypothetical protein
VNRARSDVADVAAVLVLMTAVLSLFDDTFADRTYLVTGLVPAVLLVAMALFARRFHEGGWWYSLAAVLLFAPLGALVALREPGPFLVPTFDTVSRALAETVHAPVTLVSTVPPVDPSGSVMLVPYVIAFLAVFPAAWLALSTSRPLAPAAPLVVALAATIPLGVLVPTLLVPRGILVAVLVLVWSSARARRSETRVGGTHGSAAAATTAVLTVVAVSGLSVLLVPDDDVSDRVLLRGEGNSPLVADAAASVLPPSGRDDLRLFKASGVPEGQRLRIAALDLYDGEAWVPAEESPGSGGYGTFKRIGSEVAPLHPGTTVVVTVQFRPGYSSDWLPMLGELTTLHMDWNPGRTEVSDVRYNQATSSALVVGGVDVRDQYAFESVVGDDSVNRRDATREPTDAQRQPDGAFLDSYLRPFDRDELLPLERVLLLARYLRVNGTVRETEAFDQSPATLGERMLGARSLTGSQFQYSALMALAASRLGVAARVVNGAAPGPRGLVDYGDITSWVELQFADGSWRILDPERYVGSHVATEGTAPARLPDAAGFVREQLDHAARGGDRELQPSDWDPDAGTGRSFPVWAVAGLGAGALAALVLLGCLLVAVAKVVRRRHRRTAGGWSGVYVNAWQEVLDAARDRGTPVPDGWSRVAQARRLGTPLELARRADAAVFAPVPEPADAGRDFWAACQQQRRVLLGEVGVRRRLWAQVNPASLLAGWARGRAASANGEVRHEDRRPRGQHAANA